MKINLKTYSNIYFIGIGGIGMSALAQYFKADGKQVCGYDRTPSEITNMLESKGIKVHFTEDINNIPESFKNTEKTLVIYTPAIPKEHIELAFFQKNGFQVVKRSEVLGLITENSFCLAVAGTHGKTTTSSILAHILVENKASVSAFLGGIAENFNSNLVLNGSQFTVVEADEFDRSFLKLSPDIACITAIDSDHLDIYGNEDEFRKGFEDFTKKIKPNGKLIIRNNLPFKGLTYGIENEATNNIPPDYIIKNIRVENGAYIFDIEYPEAGKRNLIENCTFIKPGRHNLLNALVAVAIGHLAGFPIENLAKALASFKGVKRRFSYQIRNENQVFIDDYAHHPTELTALHQAVREMHPNKRCTIVFQPHLYTRTRDFADGFAESLALFDQVVLLDIYPARELPIEGVSSEWLFDKISSKDKILIPKEQLLDWVSKNRTEVLICAGAGDIGVEVEKIKEILIKTNK